MCLVWIIIMWWHNFQTSQEHRLQTTKALVSSHLNWCALSSSLIFSMNVTLVTPKNNLQCKITMQYLLVGKFSRASIGFALFTYLFHYRQYYHMTSGNKVRSICVCKNRTHDLRPQKTGLSPQIWKLKFNMGKIYFRSYRSVQAGAPGDIIFRGYFHNIIIFVKWEKWNVLDEIV